MLGPYQQIVMIDLDRQPTDRKVRLTLLSDTPNQ
jgi:hypothetical protein